VLRRERVDVVQSHIFPSILIARIAAWLAGARHVTMLSSPRHLEAPLTRLAERRTWWMDDATVSGCSYTSRAYAQLGLSEERREVIYYGADATTFDPGLADGARIRAEFGIAADVPVVTIVANFYPPVRGPQAPPHTRGAGLKGHEFFLDAARIVASTHPEARFLVVGSGVVSEGERYRLQLADACRADAVLRDRVIFTGQRTDVRDILAATDVAVQCSLVENLGGTIEALLMERPTVATDVGGMPEAVRHEETGLVVPHSNAEALARAILRLIECPDEAQRFARAGRRLMLSRFTMHRTVADVDHLLERIGRAR
jgi:glycosyltransferase involved in cell wall biosynthesis